MGRVLTGVPLLGVPGITLDYIDSSFQRDFLVKKTRMPSCHVCLSDAHLVYSYVDVRCILHYILLK